MWKLPFSLSGRVCLCFSGLSFYFLSTVCFSCRCVVLFAFVYFCLLVVALLRRSGSMLLCSLHCFCFRAVCVVCLVFVLTVLFALFAFFVLCDFFVSCLHCCIDCIVPVVFCSRRPGPPVRTRTATWGGMPGGRGATARGPVGAGRPTHCAAASTEGESFT